LKLEVNRQSDIVTHDIEFVSLYGMVNHVTKGIIGTLDSTSLSQGLDHPVVDFEHPQQRPVIDSENKCLNGVVSLPSQVRT
jgi:hypothetical protein